MQQSRKHADIRLRPRMCRFKLHIIRFVKHAVILNHQHNTIRLNRVAVNNLLIPQLHAQTRLGNVCSSDGGVGRLMSNITPSSTRYKTEPVFFKKITHAFVTYRTETWSPSPIWHGHFSPILILFFTPLQIAELAR